MGFFIPTSQDPAKNEPYYGSKSAKPTWLKNQLLDGWICIFGLVYTAEIAGELQKQGNLATNDKQNLLDFACAYLHYCCMVTTRDNQSKYD